MTPKKQPKYVNLESAEIKAQFNSALGINFDIVEAGTIVSAEGKVDSVLDKEAALFAALEPDQPAPPTTFQNYL